MADDALPRGPETPGPEEAWLVAAGRGDRSALEALYARFARPLMAFLFALTADAAEAQDLVQETFLKAWRAAPRWEPRAKASTWLFQIARRAAWNALAKRRPVRLADLPASRGPHPDAARAATPATPPEAARDDALATRLSAAIAELTPPLRLVFVLVRVCGLPLAEAARVADVPVGTVKSRLAAAEARLRARLADLAPDAERGPDPRR